MAAVVLLPLLACEDAAGPSVTQLVVEVVGPQGTPLVADRVFLHMTGSGVSEHVISSPGESVTFDLSPGSYQVAAEGLTADQVEWFGQTEATVEEGTSTPATIIAHRFVPSNVQADPESTALGQPVTIEWSGVVGAAGYTVEWDDDQAFTSPTSTQTGPNSPIAEVILQAPGTFWVRVRAQSPFFDATSAPSGAVTVGVAIQGSVTVSLTAEGEDVNGATVTLAGPSGQQSKITSAGTATFTGLTEGSYSLTLSGIPSDYVFGTTTMTTNVTAAQPDATVSFTGTIVRTASISGGVTASGSGVSGVEITIDGPEGSLVSQTGSEGNYSFVGLRSGSYTVSITGNPDEARYTFNPTSQTVDLSTGEAADLNFAGTESTTRENPAGIGEPVTVQADDILFGGATVRLTLLQLVSGPEALDIVMAANQFNDPPPDGFEYVLGRFQVEVLELEDPSEAYGMSSVEWEAFAGNGTLNPDPSVCCLEPDLFIEGFAGASWEGWATFNVRPEDGTAVGVYQRGRSGEAWFTLR